MTATAPEVCRERYGTARDLIEELQAELHTYGETPAEQGTWPEAGTLGAAIDHLREALVAVQALNR